MRLRKKIVRFKEWYLATKSASRVFRKQNSVISTIRLMFRVSKIVIRGIVMGDVVSKLHWIKRIHSGCMKCELYDRSSRTCGTVGSVNFQGRQIGCLCWMPFKARFRKSKCWIEESGLQESRWSV